MSETQIAEASPEELACLSAVLDEIIPPSAPRGMPGAGEAGLAQEIAAEVPDLLPTLRHGLAALDQKARSRGATDFTALNPGSGSSVAAAPAAAG